MQLERGSKLSNIAAVVLTHNEERNIGRCLASLEWCDQIVVVDSGSVDQTLHLCERAGARVLKRPFDNFANQRNFAVDNGDIRAEWVLHIDADEEVSSPLRQELLELSRSSKALPGYMIPEKLILHGRWLKHSGMYPRYQVRFGRVGSLRFTMVGHGQRETLSACDLGTARGELIHYNFSKGISEWFTKHARYARDEAKLSTTTRVPISSLGRALFHANGTFERRRALKSLANRMPLRPLLRFIYVYFVRRGFLDGTAGFRYALMLGVYQWMIDLNELELKESRPNEANSAG